MVSPKISRFSVWQAQLNPTQGAEMSKSRPCVVVSPDELTLLKTVIIAPMTSKGFAYPSRIACCFDGKDGLIVLDQLQAVDKARLTKQLGFLDDETQIEVCERLQEMFAF